MKKYRNEWKYIISNRDIDLLKSRICNLLNIDENSTETGNYYIHSLYFDDYKNTCAKQVDAGDFKRYKWRIRFYNDSNEKIFLEKKEKLFGKCYKRKCLISLNEYNAIINRDVTNLIWKTDKKLLKEFIIDILNKGFSPKVIIDYERCAFVEEITNIRITIDTNITSSYEIDKFLENDYLKYPIQEKNMHVLEVKFDYILPGYIKNFIYSNSLNQTSFSKYYLGRKKLNSWGII